MGEYNHQLPADSTALITGASRGLGRAIALRLARHGARIIVHYHQNRAAAENVCADALRLGASARIAQADVGSIESIDKLAEQLAGERLNILVNNAGIWKPSPLGSAAAADVERIIAVNLTGVFWLTQRVLPLLADSAHIVNVSSVAGRVGIAGGRSLYGATKAAVDALTKNWAMELAPRKIRVNAVAPGYLLTDMTVEHFSNPQTLERAVQRHPFGKLSTVDEVAEAVAFLCSPASGGITGQSINISGGFVI